MNKPIFTVKMIFEKPMKKQNSGTGFENAIEKMCIHYEKQGIAKIHKTSIPSKYVYNGKVLQLNPMPDRGNRDRPNPWLDFAGVITETGELILIECKDVDVNNLPINSRSNGKGISITEAQSIREWFTAGAIVLLLWFRNGECRKMHLSIDDMNEKSIPWKWMIGMDGYKFL